jgi:hypothetical protein
MIGEGRRVKNDENVLLLDVLGIMRLDWSMEIGAGV